MIATYDGGASPASSARSASSSASGGSCSSPPPSSWPRTRLVLSLASCTLGWSNGLMPSTQPATAVANSAKKKIAPEVGRALAP